MQYSEGSESGRAGYSSAGSKRRRAGQVSFKLPPRGRVARLLPQQGQATLELRVSHPDLGTAVGSVPLSPCSVTVGRIDPRRFPSVGARKAWLTQQKKQTAPGVVSGLGWIGGGVLIGAGIAQRVQAAQFAEVAREAEVHSDYEDAVAAGEAANLNFAVLTGAGAAMLSAGLVAGVAAGVQSSKARKLKERYEESLEATVELESVTEWED